MQNRYVRPPGGTSSPCASSMSRYSISVAIKFVTNSASRTGMARGKIVSAFFDSETKENALRIRTADVVSIFYRKRWASE